MTEPRKEKNSERLEIRLPYSKKQAFMDACENQSDTPSNAIRRFINSYIRRTSRDEMSHPLGALKRRLLPVSLVAFFLVSLATWVVWNTVSSKPERLDKSAIFAIYDKDSSGFIERGELAQGENDIHLFQVMNTDGDELISLDEFTLKGDIAWTYKKDDLPLKEGNSEVSFKTPEFVHYVQFDFTNVDDPFITFWTKYHSEGNFSFRADVVVFKNLPENRAEIIK